MTTYAIPLRVAFFTAGRMTTPLVLRYNSRNLAEACLKLASEYMNGLFNDLVDPDLAKSGPSYAAGRRSRRTSQ